MSKPSRCCYPDCEAAPSDVVDLPMCSAHAAHAYRTVAAQAQRLVVENPSRMPTSGGARPLWKATARGWLYFAERGSYIKIGFSTDPKARAATLGCRLLHVEAGTFADEAAAHDRYSAYRVGTSEWFEKAPAVMARATPVMG